MKSCVRCKMALDTAQEHHIIVVDKQGKEVLNKLYYHRECWRELMTGKGALYNLQKQTADIMHGIKNQLGIKDEYKIE